MTEQTATEPSDDDRRRAACMAMGSAPGLIRFAARYTRSLHDAEDAYQRAMEIALTKAPVTEERRFMAWLHTVLRNEALAVARGRRREGPSPEADVPEAYAGTLEEAVSLDALAEWRERYRSIQDGLAGLTHAQRVCLMLQTAGVSYERIREITGFSLRKVERSVLEGRASLAAWEVRLATGEDCERMDPLIGLVAGGRASSRETRIVSRHLRNCGPCRALLRDRRESNEWLAGLVPIAFLGGHAFSAAPDPGPALAWWERVSGGATVRMGSLIQMAMELPSSALAKVGAGTAAVAVAGVAAVPIVADTVRPADGVPPVAAAVATEIRPGVAGVARGPAARRELPSRAARGDGGAGGDRGTAAALGTPAEGDAPRADGDRRGLRARRNRGEQPVDAGPVASGSAGAAALLRRGPGVRAMRRRWAVCVLALAGTGLAPGSAVATDGNLYGFGASAWAVSPPFTTTVPAPQVWLVQAPALANVPKGNWWEMNWGCPVPGSEIAAVQWSALRTQPASSLALQVTGDRQVLWAEGDAAIPLSPAAGRAYDIRLPGGNCNVHLALTQMEERPQHARGYFIDNPRVLVRDLAPPAVVLSAAPGGWVSAASAPAVGWVVTDNFGADGVGAQSALIDGQVRWSGAPGTGSHRVELPLTGLSDGVHTLEVRADGDGTGGGGAQAQIAVDGTAPRIHGFGAHMVGEPGGADLTWRVDDDLSGVTGSRAEINAATDGTSGGDWIPIGVVSGEGEKLLGLRAAPVADGIHSWRVTATDGAGNARVQLAPTPLVVDTTPPRLELNEIPAGWVNRAALDLTVSDDLEAAVGPGRVEVDVNSAPDGGETGQWLRRGAVADAVGRRLVPVDLSGLEDGPHAVRVVARNGGPLAGALAREKRTTVRVDRTDPVVASATFSSRGPRLTVAWVATDDHSGVSSALVQWRDGLIWRTLAHERAADGGGSVVVDTSAMPTGERTVRLLVGDAAGNETARTAAVAVSGHGRGAAAGLVTRLRSARLSLSVDRARLGRRDGRVVLVHRTATGRSVTVRGRLLDGRGRPVVGVEVQARDERDLLIGSGNTRRNGTFEMVARPIGGGLVRIGVGVGAHLLPRNAAADLVLEVRPRMEVGVSTTRARVGERVVFTGRLRPSPAELGLGGRKGVVLEWRDPLRHTWRPVVNARMRADGTFTIPWAFGLGGLTIPTRVVVPAEVGWPLLPARSRVIPVRVG